MKFKMAQNSLFAILLRKPWWMSLALGAALGLVGVALLPRDWRIAGALSGFPFLVIAAIAAWTQRQLPSAARVEQVHAAVAAMAWPPFAGQLEAAFRRDGYSVERGRDAPVDFVLERQGRRMLVAARRWKSAHTGLEMLRALQAAREASDDMITDALVISLGELTDNAREFAARHRIAVWQAAELAQALRELRP